MKVYLLRRERITRSGLLLALFVLAFVLAMQAQGLQRRLMGAKPGVMLENQPVGGLLPEEVSTLIQRLLPFYEREPRNASYFSETGQVIPELDGVVVDVAGTVRAVFEARPQSEVHMITHALQPSITTDYFTPIFRGSADRAEVSLAINVAWGEESLPAMLDILKREGVCATFFFVGDWARKFPEMVRGIDQAGHEVANHGLYHGQPLQLSRSDLTSMIVENNALLTDIIGHQPSALFAPPSGEFDQRTVGVAAELGYRTILWTVDTIDWKLPSPDLIVSRVVNKVKNGAIILMHPTPPTVAALPTVIQSLHGKGYNFVTISQLLAPDQEP